MDIFITLIKVPKSEFVTIEIIRILKLILIAQNNVHLLIKKFPALL